ncbi:MAG: ABC transporter permease [Desulfobulbaceae bacterium]|nr:ABC transporter permease [Desulfobulbaceae bacterium]
MENTSLVRQGFRSALRDWKRSLWLVLGVALGMAFYVTVATLGSSYTKLVKLPFSRLETDLIVQVGTKGTSQAKTTSGTIRLPFSNQPVTPVQIKAVASLDGIKNVSSALLLWHQENKTFATIAGIDPQKSTSGPSRVMQWISKGRALEKSGDLVVESHYARFNRLKIGSIVSLLGVKGRNFHIVGISKIKEGASLAAANYYLSIQDARRLAGLPDGTANLLAVTLKQGVRTETIEKKIHTLLPGAMVSSTDSIGDMMQGFAKISGTGAKILSLIGLVFTLLLACWLIHGRLQEQRRQVGLMRTLGWQRKEIVFTYGIESMTLVAAGCLAGIAMGLLGTLVMGSFDVTLTLPWNLNPTPGGMHHTGTGQTVQIPLPVTLQPVTILFGLAVTCLAGVFTGLLTAAGLASKKAGQTLREQ